MANFDLDPGYIDVAARIAEFRTKHPEGSLQQHALEFRAFAGKDWVIYTAAAYRTPDDERPGIGTAWEPVPGRTPFTRDSELQNAETAAWGRAIVAVLAADTKKSVASAEEVRNRTADRAAPPDEMGQARNELWRAAQRHGTTDEERWAVVDQVLAEQGKQRGTATAADLRAAITALDTGQVPGKES